MEKEIKLLNQNSEKISNCINKKTNKKFMLLSMFGIIFVVMGHCYGFNAFFNNVFPFNSFHMALFAFVSGYFFKDKNIVDFLKNKTKKLILTYLIWNFIYGVIVFVLKKVNLINFGGDLTLYNIFVAPFCGYSNQFSFNASAWFLITIYFVQVIYFLFNKVIVRLFHLNTEIIMTILSIILAILTLNILLNKQNIAYSLFLPTRIVFLMPFYSIAQIYKKIEKYDKLNNIAYFSILLVIQVIMIQKFRKVGYNLNLLTFKHNYIVYLICSMTGILFWLRISNIFKDFIADNKIVSYIGNNTFTIMMHHMFIIFTVNTIIYGINNFMGRFGKFNVSNYKNKLFYFYNTSNAPLMLVYAILGISVPILLKYFVYDRMGRKINSKKLQIDKIAK